jgi:predicted nuclease of predicted toxin-antitoxin system
VTIVIDNCLPLSWVEYLRERGHAARHWRELGPPNAPDSEILQWANRNQAVVLTQDLDFTKLLFQSRAALPSVIQLRLDDVRPQSVGEDVALILEQRQADLQRGVLISVKGHKARLRLLPLGD